MKIDGSYKQNVLKYVKGFSQS